MAKTKQPETPLERLVLVVEEHDQIRAELDRLQKLEPALQGERQSLIASGKFDDAAAVSAASAIDLKLRMLPHKVRQLEDYLASLDDALYRAALAVRSPLIDQVETLWETVCTEACEKVKGLGIAMEDGAFDKVVDTVLRGCPVVAEILELRLIVTESPRIAFAEAILQRVPRVERLKALPAGKRLAWTPAKAA